MIIELDEIVRVGAVAIAAIAKRSVHRIPFAATSFHVGKRPVAILVRCEDETMAFDVDGARIALDDLDRRYPGQRASFEHLAAGQRISGGFE